MPSTAGGVRAGKAFIELFADNTALVKGLKGAESQLKSFGAGVQSAGVKMAAIGAAAIAPLAMMTNSFVDYGTELDKTAAKTGMTTDALQRLAYAAKMSNIDFGTMATKVRFMQKNIDALGQGNKQAVKTFDRLGLTMADLKGKTPDEQMAILADKIRELPDSAAKTAVAMSVFGRAGAALLPLLLEGGDAIRAYGDEAQRTGYIMSTDDVAAAASLNNTMDRLGLSFVTIKNVVGASLAPIFEEFATTLTDLARATSRWIKQHPDAVRNILKIAAAVTVAGGVLIALGVAIKGAAMAFGLVTSVISGVSAVFGTMTALLSGLLSPFALVAGAAVGLGAYLLYSGGAGELALGWLGKSFNTLAETANTAWGGIKAALSSGDLGAAANIAWLAIQLAWLQGTQDVMNIWYDFTGYLQENMDTAGALFGGSWEQTWAAVQTIFFDICDTIHLKWLALMKSMISALKPVLDGIAKALGIDAISKATKNVASLEKMGLITGDQAASINKDLEAGNIGGARAQVDTMVKSGAISEDVGFSLSTSMKDATQTMGDSLALEMENVAKTRTGRWGELMQKNPDMANAIVDTTAATQARTKAKKDALQAEIDAKKGQLGDAAFNAQIDAILNKKQEDFTYAPPATPALDPAALDSAKVAVMGTFSGINAAGMGVVGVQDKIAKATQQTADNTDGITDAIEESGEEFT